MWPNMMVDVCPQPQLVGGGIITSAHWEVRILSGQR